MAEETEPSGTFSYVQIVRYLFLEYAAENNITTDVLHTISMRDFSSWVKKKRLPFTPEVREMFKARLGADDSIIDDTQKALKDPFHAFMLLNRLRYVLALAGRPACKNPPTSVSVVIEMDWGDRREVVRMHADPEAVDFRLTDGQLCALISVLQDEAIKMIAINGIDSLYAEAGKSLPEPEIDDDGESAAPDFMP